MARKRNNPFDMDGNELPPMFGPLIRQMQSEEGRLRMGMMRQLILKGVTPEEFKEFYDFCMIVGGVKNELSPSLHKEETSRGTTDPLLENASEKTLRLKVQMKDVTKPPMWREVDVPADMSFFRLHKVIQAVMGFEDCHLWQFNEKAYTGDVQIGVEIDDNFGYGDDITDEAISTPLSAYLSNVGDKLEYVYDFGDDWIFTVTVKKVIGIPCKIPVCTGFKSVLNAMEDTGGPWTYEYYRQLLIDWPTYTKKQQKQIAEEQAFDSPAEFKEFLDHSLFDMDYVNAILRNI